MMSKILLPQVQLKSWALDKTSRDTHLVLQKRVSDPTNCPLNEVLRTKFLIDQYA